VTLHPLDAEEDNGQRSPWPTYPSPRDVVDRLNIHSLRDALGNRCPFCNAVALELLEEETTFLAECGACGRRATRYALSDAALHSPGALERILEPYDGLWDLLTEEGRIP